MRRLSRDYLATGSRALSAAQSLASIASWHFDAHPDALLRGLHDCRYEPVADMLLTPWGANSVPTVEHQLRSARCEAVLPASGKTNDGQDTLYVSVALWSAARINWHHALRLWRAPDSGGAWLVPDPDGDAPGGVCFHLGRHRLQPIAEQPWEDAVERDAGLEIANALIAAWPSPAADGTQARTSSAEWLSRRDEKEGPRPRLAVASRTIRMTRCPIICP